jgi:hypothetical protein
MDSTTRNRFQLSLVQMMKLVIYAAVASACAAPMAHLWQVGVVEGGRIQGLLGVVLFESVLVPLVWVGLSVLLIRRGAWRDGLICALMLCSVSVALGTACWALYAFIPAYGNSAAQFGMAVLALHVMLILALVAAVLWLALRLWSCTIARKRIDRAA